VELNATVPNTTQANEVAGPAHHLVPLSNPSYDGRSAGSHAVKRNTAFNIFSQLAKHGAEIR